MIPTAMRAATVSGIALCIKHLLSIKASTATYDAKNPEKFQPPAGR
jgi:hypothetical protein